MSKFDQPDLEVYAGAPDGPFAWLHKDSGPSLFGGTPDQCLEFVRRTPNHTSMGDV